MTILGGGGAVVFKVYDDFEDGVVDTTKWTAEYELEGASLGTVTETNGSMEIYAKSIAINNSAETWLTSTKDFKDSGYVEFDVMIGINNGYGASGNFSLQITNGASHSGTDVITLKKLTGGSVSGSGTGGGGGYCARLLFDGDTVTGTIIGGQRGSNFLDIISKDVSAWSNVYIEFYAKGQSASDSSKNAEVWGYVSHLLYDVTQYL